MASLTSAWEKLQRVIVADLYDIVRDGPSKILSMLGEPDLNQVISSIVKWNLHMTVQTRSRLRVPKWPSQFREWFSEEGSCPSDDS